LRPEQPSFAAAAHSLSPAACPIRDLHKEEYLGRLLKTLGTMLERRVGGFEDSALALLINVGRKTALLN
jgi:hypothetical protein